MPNTSSYGTNGSATANHHQNGHHEESALLHPHKPPARSYHHYLTQPITRTHADLILLLCYIITGLLDASATLIWGAFVSMQTGNSIYLGLGLVDPSSSDRWIKSALSISAFCLGSFLFSRLHRIFSGVPRRRWIMISSFTLQTFMIVAAAVILRLTPAPDPGDQHDLHWHVLVPLGLIAGQSAGQTVASRALEWNSMTSTVLTSVYCDLWSDRRLFEGVMVNGERNRRLAAPVLLVVGSMVGGLWAKTEIGVEGALWVAAVVKAGIVVAWVVWREEREEDDENEG